MATYSSVKQAVADAAGVGGSVTTYSTPANLPTSGNEAGDQAFVSSNNRLYIWNGSGWYNIALINNNPSFTSSPDGSYALATDGTSTTITLVATDPEGIPITYTTTTDSNFDGLATVSNDSSVFTITPLSADSATASSGNLTFKASDGVNLASAVSEFTLSLAIENSAQTALLAKATGNAGTNTTFTDGSTNSHTVTVNGDAASQAFTPYHPGGYSAEFNGSNSQITAAHSTDFNIYGYTNGFTIEGWIYPRSYHSSSHGDGIICKNSGSSGWIIRLGASSGPKLQFVHPGTAGTGPIGNNVPLNEWTHFAFTRATNGDFKYYQNGILVHSFTLSGTNRDTSQTLYVGHESSQSSARFDGYIRDVRISDTIVYSDNFTLPTEGLTSTSNTKFLACHLPYIAEGSSAGHALSPSNIALDRFSPYDYVSYVASTHGSSVYLDGTGDYLQVADHSGFTIDTGDFTAECWIYPTAQKYQPVIFGQWSDPYSWGILLSNDTNGYGRLIFYDTGYRDTTSTTPAALNQWSHLALVKDGSTATLYLNGKSIATRGSLGSLRNSTAPLTIGANSSGSHPFQGYVADARFVVGSTLYTTNFTPPAAPLSAVTNTQLLVQASPSVYDASGGESKLDLNGNAQSSTAQTKNASSSMYFDGSGDYATTTTNDVYTYGTGDFTIDAWVYITSNPGNYAYILGQGGTVGSSASFGIYIQSGVFKVYNNAVVITGTTSYSLNTWHHVVLTRGDGKLSLFLDGSLEGSTSNTNNITTGSTMGPTIGGWIEPGDTGYFTGYIEDLRITKGLSRYPFIPTQETLTAVSNTKLLTAHSETITDGSTSSHTVTTYGDAAVSNFAPAANMKSIYLDGTGDYLTIAGSTDFAMASNDFTIEFWYYPTSISSSHNIHDQRTTDSQAVPWIGLHSNGYFYYYVSGANRIAGNTGSVTANKWYHVAISRVSGTTRLFVNGSQAGSDYSDSTSYAQGGTLYIGKRYTGTALHPIGYLSNYRIVNGTGVYANSFTPPTSELKG